jgi:hypothetical protein
MTPRWAREASGTGAGVLGGDAVEVSAKPSKVDARSASEHCDGGIGIHEPVASKRSQLPDGYAMSSDDEGLTPVQPPHDLATVVPELTLRDVSSHAEKCSTTCYTMVIRLAAQSNSLNCCTSPVPGASLSWLEQLVYNQQVGVRVPQKFSTGY